MLNNPTGQTIINNALTYLGILEQGGAPSSSDSNFGLSTLNTLWDALQIDEGMIFGVAVSHVGPVAPNVQIITFGIGGVVPAVPSRIFGVQWYATVGAGQNRKEIRIVDAATYFAHGDLNASASAPDEIFFDWNINESNLEGGPFGVGQLNAYLYPVPNCPTTSYIDFETGSPFLAWTLAGAVYLPYGFQDLLEWILAFRMLSGFGAVVSGEVVQNVTQNGAAAEARVRAMNARNRMIPAQSAEPPQLQLQQAAPQKGA